MKKITVFLSILISVFQGVLGNGFNFSLPVNALNILEPSKCRVHLAVKVSDQLGLINPFNDKEVLQGYSMVTSMSSFMSASPSFYQFEFVPAKESACNWSEILTVSMFKDRGLQASVVTEYIKERMVPYGNILEENVKTHQNHTESRVIIKYTHPVSKRQELLLLKYYSGLYDCSGFQYAVAVNKTMSEKDAIDKIKNFEKQNTEIIFF